MFAFIKIICTFVVENNNKQFWDMAHIIDNLEEKLAEYIAGGLIGDAIDDEIEIEGTTFVFDFETSVQSENIYTGVEYMGYRESYSRPVIEAKITYMGAFDFDGEDVSDIVKLNMENVIHYLNKIDDDYAKITAHAA